MGDFYDVIPHGGDVGVVIGVVAGHGPQAARATAMARSAIRTAAHLQPAPATVLRTVNAVLRTWFDGRSGFVTAAYIRLRPPGTGPDRRWTGEVACAGHPPAFVLRRSGAVDTLDGGGTVLGILPDGNVHSQTLSLDPGDSLVLYTDGITEARPAGSTQQLDDDGVTAVLASLPPDVDAEHIARAVADAASDHAGGFARDDAGVLVVRIPLHKRDGGA